MLGTIILFATLKIYGFQPAEIGFAKKGVLRRLAEGVAFGLIVFVSAAITSSLFGLWHIMAPVRSYCDGTMSRSGFIANAVLLVTTSALVGFKFTLMTRLTGSLYMAMGHHFTNNAVINMLHVVSSTGTDSLMIVRISIAQSISFIIVWIWYLLARRSHNVCFP